MKGIDRDRIQMISLEQMVEKDSMARVIDVFVDMLDLEGLGFTYFTLNKERRPPFHPAAMIKIFFMGTTSAKDFVSFTYLDMPLKKINVLADKGYHSGRELKAGEDLKARRRF